MREIPIVDAKDISRRKFLTRLSIWSGVFAASLVSVPFVGALLDPVIKQKREVWRSVGKVADFPVGDTKMVVFTNAEPKPYGGVTDHTAAWLRRDTATDFIAFAVNCTHLGCPVRWEEGAQLFMCPCHGGAYYKNGQVAAGPPPKQLQQYPVRVNGDDVEIKTSPVPLTEMTA
jgi:menaquinol-cytochrome c reductase iron-sulfur subunit